MKWTIAVALVGGICIYAFSEFQKSQHELIDLSNAVGNLKKDYAFTGTSHVKESFRHATFLPGSGFEDREDPVGQIVDKTLPREVKPGIVNWHNDLDGALASSAKSKKPVLLFELLGNLDDRFC